jgi:hypothetical protein
MNPRKLPLLRTLTRFGLLLGLLTTEARAANLFLKQDIPGWPSIPSYAVFSAWGDYDGDGLPDVFVARVKTASFIGATTNLLYRNNGDGSFTPKLEPEVGPIVGEPGEGYAGHWIDVNGDGHLDLWVRNGEYSPPYSAVVNPLYLNRGDGTFASVQAGALTQPSYPAANNCDWTDYDNDGLLDVFIPSGWASFPTRTNVLLHGRADGTFEAVTTGPVVTDTTASVNDSIWGDLDNDGDADLLVANLADAPAFHYRNDGHGVFTRMTNSILEQFGYRAGQHGLADVDNDGDLDVLVKAQSTFICSNDGTGQFVRAQSLVGGSPGVAYFGDYDNDGDVDIIFSEVSVSAQPLTLYRNDGTGKFTGTSEAFTGVGLSWVVGPWVDYDNNGFLDLFVGRTSGANHPIALYQNQGNGNHWLKFRLVGTHSNRSALGAKVRVRATIGGRDVRQMRSLSASLYTEDGGRAHFGLGDATQADMVRIEWPSGVVQELTGVAADRFLTVTEPTPIRLAITRSGEALHLELRGAASTPYELQRSADLKTWSANGTLTTDAAGLAMAPAVSPVESGFYRAIRR